MKKQFTLLAGVLLAGSTVFAQAPTTTAKAAPKKLDLNGKKTAKTVVSSEKLEGDIIYQNDFSTASDWTITTAGQGTWVIGTTAHPDFSSTAPGMGAYNGLQFSTFNPTTKANGFAGFNALKFLVPATPVVSNQNSSITSGTIDFTGKSVVTLSFYQWYMAFNYDNVYFEYSMDNGATWPVSIQLNGAVATNTRAVGNTSVDFNSMGAATGKIRFRWESISTDPDYGSGYGWTIDDVKIVEGAANKVNLIFAHHTVGVDNIQYTKFPANQVTGNEKITFGAEVQNVGGNAINAYLNVSSGSYNETGTSVSIASFAYDSLAILDADGYVIPATPGVHNFTYAIGASTDLSNSSDSSEVVKFEVTPSVMAVDSYDGTVASITGSFGNWSTQTSGDFTGIGNIFTTYDDGVVGAVQVGFDEVSDESVYDQKPFTVNILQFDETSGWVLINQTDGEMQTAYFGSLATVYLTEPLNVAAGDIYAVIIGSFVGDNNAGGLPIAFAGTNIAGNTIGTDDINFEGLISLASDDLTPNIVDAPVVRMDFTDYTSVKEINIAGDVTVAPNPFSDETAISFTLKNDAKVSVVITDLSGRTVMTVPSSAMNAGKQTVAINGSAFKAGVYNYTLTVDGNSVTKRIVKK